ncbi:hypothetical protein BC834DRAFT_855154 [Gloeopeniophorella convolvens]|nr:hypothetical protein BC834DRAFT_855154 [Gloeopeniophorella convolvens]
MAAIYAVYTSPTHPPIPNHLPTLINSENYLLTPSPQGDLCVAKLFPPRPNAPAKASASDPGHGSAHGAAARVVRCEASRNLKWSITNTGRIEFGKIQKNPPGPNGGGTRITISGKTPDEKAVWQTLGEGNEDCVEWVVLCAALNLLDDEIIKAAEKGPQPPAPMPMPAGSPGPGPNSRPAPVSLRDPGAIPQQQPSPQMQQQRGPPPPQAGMPPPQNRPPPQGYPQQRPQGAPPPQGYMPSPGQPRPGMPPGPNMGLSARSPPPPQQQQPQQAVRRF